MNHRRRLILVLSLGVLTGLSIIGYLIWSDYRQAVDAAEIRTSDYAAILETRLDATLRRADANLMELVRDLPVAALNKEEVPRYATRLNAGLDLRMVNFPEMAGFRVFDAAGNQLYSSDRANTPLGKVGDRDYFHRLRDDPKADLVFSEVNVSRTTGRPTLVAGRAVRDNQGAFRGIVIASIELDFFQKLFQSLALPPQSVVSIYRRDDFSRVVRWPVGDGKFNTKLPPDNPTRAALESDKKAVTTTFSSFADSVMRIYSFHVLNNYPFYVAVGVARDEALGAWRTRALGAGLSGLLVFAAIAWMLYLLWRSDAAKMRAMSILVEKDQTLMRNERLLRNAQQAAKIGCYATSLETGAWECTPVMNELFGISETYPHTTEGWVAFMHPDFTEPMNKYLREVILERKSFNAEYKIIRPSDGAERWMHGLGQITYDDKGGVVSLTGTVQDVTERKQADESLRSHQIELEMRNEELHRTQVQLDAERERYFDLYDMAPVGFCTLGEKGLILQANLTAATLFGVARGALVGQPLSWFIFKDDQDIFYRKRKQVVESGEPQVFELRLAMHGGTPFWAHLTAIAAQGVDGASELRVALSDITERKRAEAALQESRDQFQRVVELSPYSMSLVNSDGTIEYVNRKAIDIFGYLPQEIPDMDSWWKLAYPDAGYRAEVLKQWTALVVKARTQNGEIESREYRVTCKDRSVKALRIFGVWIENKVLVIFEDVTERRWLEESHLQAQKLESLGTLSAGIAHDFNNILGAIRGFSDIAAEEVGPDHVAAESLKRISQASARATELVRRITTFGQRKQGKRAPAQVDEVVVEVISLLRATLPATISLATAFARDTPPIVADIGQIHEAVVNLTTNAAYAIGGKAGTIEYRTEMVRVDAQLAQLVPNLNPGRFVRLSVTDSGGGMNAQTMERIFDAFYTTKPIGQGTGLGLSMVYGIMQGHEGAVSVDSAPGKGASFHLYFPVADVAIDAEQAIRPAESVVTAAKRVIYVDDEEPLAFLAKRVLSRMGHSVEVFTDPKEALASCRAHPQDYDIVVTDLTMPGMSGFDLSRALLAMRPDIPVLVTTGYVRDEDEVMAREIGIREIILKPISVAELGAVFERTFRPPQRMDKTQ